MARVFLRIGSAETDNLLGVAGLVECVFLRIGSAETDGLLCVCRSCRAPISAYWVSRDR